MNVIGSIARTAGSGLLRFARTEPGRLTIAVSLLAAAIWWGGGAQAQAEKPKSLTKKDIEPKKLSDQDVEALEKKVDSFIQNLANSASRVGPEQPQERQKRQVIGFQEIFNEVLDAQDRPTTEQLKERLTRLSKRCEDTLPALAQPASSEKLEPEKMVTPGQENLLAELKKMDMPCIVANFEDMLSQLPECGAEKDSVEAAKHFQAAIQSQLGEMIEHKQFVEYLPLLRRVEKCSHRIFQASRPSRQQKAVAEESKGIAGLANQSNSCYLHAAIQIIAAVPELSALFYFDDVEDADDAQQLRNLIYGMVQDFNAGTTVSAKRGKELQRLLKELGILDGAAYDWYDSGRVLDLMLEKIGAELPVVMALRKDYDRVHAFAAETNVHFKYVAVDVAVHSDSNQSWWPSSTNVGAAVQGLLSPHLEKKPCDGRPNRFEEHKDFKLPELLPVTIRSEGLPRGLTNIERFDDPSDSANFEYRLVAANENIGGHWVAYRLRDDGEWLRISDSYVSVQKPQNFSYAYYRRYHK